MSAKIIMKENVC